jgi:sulfur carrier protein ThiS
MFGRTKKYKKRHDPAKKRQQLIDKYLATRIATDPKFEQQWLEKKYGIYVVGSENETIAKMAAAIRKKWTSEALEILGEDTNSQETAIKELINEIKKDNALSKRSRDEGEAEFQTTDEYKQSNVNAPKRNLRKEMIKRYQDMGKNNRPATDMNASKLTSLLSEIAQRIVAGNSGGRRETIAVEVNGEFVEMSQEAYQIYKKQSEELWAARARLQNIPQKPPNSETPPSGANSADSEV